MLRDTLAQFLAQRYSFTDRVKASRSEPGFRQDTWRALAQDLGLFTLVETGDAVEQMIVMEEIGRALLLEPVAETLFQGGWLINRANASKHPLLPSLMRGEVRLALAITEPDAADLLQDISCTAARDRKGWRLDGNKSLVVAAPWADWLIVAARTSGRRGDLSGVSLFLVESSAAGVELRSCSLIDGRRAADIVLCDVRLRPDALIGQADAALPLLEELRDRAIAGLVAESCGVLSKMVDDAVDHCKQRRQFGQAIGSFQIIQHRLVDMHIELEQVRAASLLATLSLNGDQERRARAVSAAKIASARACRFIGQNAVQLHGAMGMTDYLAVSHFFRKATQMEREFSTPDWHLQRLDRHR
nr:acyl-CoA dehydrogenase [Novosphingobium sp. ERN07]